MRIFGAASSDEPYGRTSALGTEVSKLLARVALGWFLLHQGWGKVQQELEGGAGSFYQSGFFQNNNPAWLPDFIAAPYGYALPWVELVFGGLLALGLVNRISAGVSTLIFLSILVAWLDAGNLLPRHMLMIYLPLAAYFFFAGPGRYSLDAMLDRKKAS
ncbi:MAG: DoxX family protein [Gemmatimonadales bacterium]|nr:MAG: DoxX family protein [Gemmatimonadales bacterium]